MEDGDIDMSDIVCDEVNASDSKLVPVDAVGILRATGRAFFGDDQ
jgi:hypothetical protein